jgi:hypothetical protein
VAHHDDEERALNFFTRAQHCGLVLQGGANWREKHLPTGVYGTAFGDGGTKTTDSRRFAELSWTLPRATGFEPTARLYYDGCRYHGTYVYGGGPGRTKNEDFATSNWVGGELRARRELPAGHALTMGGEYSYHPRARQGPPTWTTRAGPTRGACTRSAQEEWRALASLSVVAGLRFDAYYGGRIASDARANGLSTEPRTPLPGGVSLRAGSGCGTVLRDQPSTAASIWMKASTCRALPRSDPNATQRSPSAARMHALCRGLHPAVVAAYI